VPTSSQTPPSTSLRARVPEKNSQLVALAERADRVMEKRRRSSIPVSLADLEHLKNLVHEAVELGHKARFLWLSADERADNLGRQLFDARAELARVRQDIASDFEEALLKTTDGDDVHDDFAIPAGEVRRIIAELVEGGDES
jgi:hypothetical protein